MDTPSDTFPTAKTLLRPNSVLLLAQWNNHSTRKTTKLASKHCSLATKIVTRGIHYD